MKGKGKGRRDHDKGEDTMLSKSLSWVLRHGAETQGLAIEPSGFVPLPEVMQFLKGKGHKDINEERIRKIVDTNDKKRFEILEKKHHVFIRATQGHTMKCIDTESLLNKIEDASVYPVVIHGTFQKFWPLIKQEGLKRMSRLHIHFAPGMPKEEGVISGMRGSCNVIIQIDMAAAMKDGIEFFISTNNVILTEGIDGLLPAKYFKKVTKRDGSILQENIGKVE